MTAMLSTCALPPVVPVTLAAAPPPAAMAKDGERALRSVSSGTFKGIWRTSEGRNEVTMREWHVDGQVYGLVQGDIVLGLKEDLEVGGRGLHAGYSKPWPLAIVPYTLRGDLVQRETFLKALRRFEAVRDPTTRKQMIVFLDRDDPRCPASVRDTFLDVLNTADASIGGRAEYGRARRGAHKVWLNVDSRKCTLGVVVHELMHSLGMAHEQCRGDRDDYVTIHFNQIQSGFDSEFESPPRSRSYGLYDYHSVTHYHENAFAIDGGGPTIEPKSQRELDRLPPERRVRAVRLRDIGRANNLSSGDIDSLTAIYADEFHKRTSSLDW